MAHQLEILANGQASMMYAGQAPWHGLGTSVEKEVTAGAALKLASLDWKVVKEPMYLKGVNEVDGIPVIGDEVPANFALVRDCDRRVFGVVGSAYEVIQNEDAVGFLDSLVGEGCAMFNTAGSLFDGHKVFVCCKLPSSVQVGPDQIDKYLVAMWAHDSRMAFHVKWTPIRVVCWNTASAAFQIHGGRVTATDSVTVLHRNGWKSKLDEARKVLELTDVYYQRLGECFNQLLSSPFRACDFTQFANKLVPDMEKEDGTKVDRSPIRAKLSSLFTSGIGNDHPDVKGTRWAAWNAVTEYVDHGRYANATKDVGESRMNSVIWGQGSQMKKQALDMLAV